MTTKAAFVPTEEQQEVAEAASRPESVMVNSYAGCSKTTTLELAGKRIKVPALGLAFNKKTAVEMGPRFGSNFKITTCNGYGLGAIHRVLSLPRGEPDRGKLGKLVSQVAKDHKVELSSEQWDGLRRLVSGAMQEGIVPEDEGRPLLPDTEENWREIGEGLWLTREDFSLLFELGREVLRRNNALTWQGQMSFDDQVYFSTCIAGRFPQYPVIVVDEGQDLNPLNHQMIRLSIREGGKLIVVGDQKQSIYAFRGASVDSMERLRALRSSWLDKPLTMTFRCPKIVVARQQAHAPGFRAAAGNPEGKFARFQTVDEFGEGGWNQTDLLRLLPSTSASLMVLCRNTAPLLKLAFKLIRAGIGVFILGRDIGKGLTSLSKKILPEDNTPRDICVGLVEEWRVSEVTLAVANGNDEKVDGINDRAGCLQAVLQGAQVRDAGQLRAMIVKLFSKESGLIGLSTIHQAKGLEWDSVVHLDPWRIPSKWAKEAAKLGDSRALEQEWNLHYVCETRSKHTLVEANLEDFQ